MPHYDFLITGGGMTADAAAHGIREIDSKRTIGIVGSDPDPPYDRPPLSKSLWKDKQIDSIWRKTNETGAKLHLGRTIERIDITGKRALDNQQGVYTFDKLLLATGGRPRRFPFGGDNIIYYRTAADFRRLHDLASQKNRYAVIGAGFIGSEIAAALAMHRKEVVMLFPGNGIGSRVYPAELSQHLNQFYRERGVEVLPGETVSGMESRNGQFALQTKSGRELRVDAVVAGLGIEPNVDLARAAGLKVDNGIVVNELLQTSLPDVYAAGDVAAFFNPALGTVIRVEHEDNANTMGRAAGRNMAGRREPYHHLPSFYSDLFDLGYEAVGDLDARLETVTDWKTPFREGAVFYLRAGRVRGVLLWNVWGKVDDARKLIAEPGPFKPEDLRGRFTSS